MLPLPPVAAAARVSKRFGATQALDDVSLELRAGQVHALVGENGAGKSTLIKIFGGIHRPDSGATLISGATRINHHLVACARRVKPSPPVSR